MLDATANPRDTRIGPSSRRAIIMERIIESPNNSDSDPESNDGPEVPNIIPNVTPSAPLERPNLPRPSPTLEVLYRCNILSPAYSRFMYLVAEGIGPHNISPAVTAVRAMKDVLHSLEYILLNREFR